MQDVQRTTDLMFSGRALLAVSFAAVLLVALLAAAGTPREACAANAQLDAPVSVSDEATHLNVDKLDSDTHEYVTGATMEIVNESTGQVVDSWVTTSATHENEKALDVGVTYILRELAAPDGYSAVQDVRFSVNETEGEGITVLSGGDDYELVESYKLALYDKPAPGQNETVVTKTTTSTTVAPKTGDETPLTLVAALMAVGVSAILILQVFKRRLDE